MVKSSAAEGIAQLLERFPQHWSKIQRLQQENDDFRELCHDYKDCIEALHRFRSTDMPDVQHWVDEYQALQRELETEISRYLESY